MCGRAVQLQSGAVVGERALNDEADILTAAAAFIYSADADTRIRPKLWIRPKLRICLAHSLNITVSLNLEPVSKDSTAPYPCPNANKAKSNEV